VLCLRKVSVIYLEHKSPYASSNLPPDIGRATLHASVYMILQPIRRTASRVTTQPGELLPHLFTLTPMTSPVSLVARHPLQREGTRKMSFWSGYFLLRYSAFANSFPLGNMVLYVARTFLHSTRERRQTDLLFKCKDIKLIYIFYFSFTFLKL